MDAADDLINILLYEGREGDVLKGRSIAIDMVLDRIHEKPSLLVDFIPETSEHVLEGGHVGIFRGVHLRRDHDMGWFQVELVRGSKTVIWYTIDIDV